MKKNVNKIFLIFLLLNISFCFSQTNEKLIEILIKSNSVQLDYTNNMGNEFGILLNQISDKELFELAKDKNPIIRTYAKIGMIEKKKGNILNLLESELKNNVTIEVFDACLGENCTTASIIYEKYFLKTMFEIKDEVSMLDETVIESKTFHKIDSLIIYSNCNLNNRILNRVFNRTFDKKHLPQIEKLAFEKNISHAFFYLINNDEKEYKKKEVEYFTRVFLKQKFETNNEVMNLINYLSYLLETENKILYKIGIKRLKKQEWRNHEFDFFLDELIAEKGIKI